MAAAAESFRLIWEDKPGLAGWFSTVDHKRIGWRYIMTAFFLYLIGLLEAILMRIQTAQANLQVLSPETYNQIFSMHGTTMIFLFLMPILAGFGNYLVPLMLGARDMAFPRMNAFSYWVFILSATFMYSSFVVGMAPMGGWFAYTPLTGPYYSPGINMDFYTLGLIFLGTSTTAGAINFIVSIFKLRAPGMSINRMPLFGWNILVMAFMIIFALPALTGGSALLFLDRRLFTHFFDPTAGGDPILWQQLFWIFGHPDVYILFLPAAGMVSMIIPTFSRRPMVGYSLIVFATVSVGIIAFGVWVHHMFSTGLTLLEESFFSASSLMIPIPSAVQIFVWLATIWHGRPVWRTPLLYVAGFIVLFVMGGVTGVMQAVTPFDWQVTDSYFIVAHFHYVLIGTVVFPLLGGLYYWLPKMTGRLLDERIGKISFWVTFTGFQVNFFPMHILGLLGMPRRTYTFMPGLGWDALSLVASMGAFVFVTGILISVWNFFWSMRNGQAAGDDPWDSNSLEWATSSPPPPYNFREIPVVHSRNPVWDQRYPTPGGRNVPQWDDDLSAPTVPRRELVDTSLLDGVPQAVIYVPSGSYWPIALALSLGILFFGLLIWQLLIAALGGLLAAGALIGWLFPWDVLSSERPTVA